MKRTMAFILALMMIFALCACGQTAAPAKEAAPAEDAGAAAAPSTEPAGEPIVAKFAQPQAPGTHMDVGANYFKSLVEERTNGQIIVEVYPSAQLGAEREAVEGQTIGTIEFALVGCGVLSPICGDNKCDVFDLPFLAENADDFFALLDSDLAKDILAPCTEYGVEVLATFNTGFRQMSNSVRPINSADDVVGLKLRCPEGESYMKTMDALGISATPMAFSEVFSALQTKVVDGQETPVPTFYGAGFAEVQKYFAIVNYMNDPEFITASTAFMNTLTEEQQQIIRDAAYEAALYERQYVVENEASMLQDMVDTWGMEVTNPDLASFQEKVQGVHEQYRDQELLTQVKDYLAGLK